MNVGNVILIENLEFLKESTVIQLIYLGDHLMKF